MKRIAMLLVSVLFVTFLAAAVAPVLAKPNEISISVKSATRQPVDNLWVCVHLYNDAGQYRYYWYQTDSHGKVSAPADDFSGLSGPIYARAGISQAYNTNPGEWTELYTLSNKLSARITIAIA